MNYKVHKENYTYKMFHVSAIEVDGRKLEEILDVYLLTSTPFSSLHLLCIFYILFPEA